jgi:hypothetical protein
MTSEQADAARRAIPAAISTVPVRADNAHLFLAIVEELRRSYVTEMSLIQRVARVNVSDRPAVEELRYQLEDYELQGGRDLDRTHCSSIRRIASEIERGPDAGNPQVAQVLTLVEPLGRTEAAFIDEIDKALAQAVLVISQIDEADRTEEAQRIQAEFQQDRNERLQSISSTLHAMNRTANQMLDILAGVHPE